MPVKLYGRSYPDPESLQWRSTLMVMDPTSVKGGRGLKVPCEAHGFKGLRCRRFKSFKGSRTPDVKG